MSRAVQRSRAYGRKGGARQGFGSIKPAVIPALRRERRGASLPDIDSRICVWTHNRHAAIDVHRCIVLR
jgi:hypothetical protein